MPTRARQHCTHPGCPNLVPSGRCPQHQHRPRDQRPTPAARGYDRQWRNHIRPYLAQHPHCAICGATAKAADHHPRTRRELIAAGVQDPDAWHRLRPLCIRCHNRQSARGR